MKRSLVIGLTAATMVALLGTAIVSADSGRRDMKARLSGFQEVPAISTQGTGTLRLRVNEGGTAINFELSYAKDPARNNVAHSEGSVRRGRRV